MQNDDEEYAKKKEKKKADSHGIQLYSLAAIICIFYLFIFLDFWLNCDGG